MTTLKYPTLRISADILGSSRKWSIFFFTVLSCCSTFCQSPAAPATPLAFEVASIHPHQGPPQALMSFSSSGPRLTLEGYTRRQLILEAYDLKRYQLSRDAGMNFQDDVYYDIAAKAEGDASPTKKEFRQMLQTLLAQRFHLNIHYDTTDMTVYALTIGSNGPKFKRSSPDASARGLFGVNGRNQTITMPRESMESLAYDISNIFILDRPVVDRTGLTGTYDIKLEATPEYRMGDNLQPEDISIFTAAQEQLGLKLVPAKAAIKVLVIDHIEKPSEN